MYGVSQASSFPLLLHMRTHTTILIQTSLLSYTGLWEQGQEYSKNKTSKASISPLCCCPSQLGAGTSVCPPARPPLQHCAKRRAQLPQLGRSGFLRSCRTTFLKAGL